MRSGCPKVSGDWPAGRRDGRSAWSALESGDIRTLATAFGVPRFRCGPRSGCATTPAAIRSTCGRCCRSCRSIGGNTWQPLLPAPRAFVAQVVSRLSACSPSARALVEACSVLGVRSSLQMAAALAGSTIRWAPSRRPSRSGCSRAPTRSISGTSRSPIPWCRRRCTSTSSPTDGFACTASRHSWSTMPGPHCGTGSPPRLHPTASSPRRSTPSPVGRCGGGPGRAQHRRWWRRVG